MTKPRLKDEREISVERLRDWFTYAPETGSLKWKVRKWTDFKRHSDWLKFCAKYSCKEAGAPHNKGYRVIHTAHSPVNLYAHRIIWAMQTGSWPAHEIDHVNQDPTDNRWANLRIAPGNANALNRSQSRANTSGTTGVCWNKKEKKWQAQVMLNGKRVFYKYFPTKTEAVFAVLAAREFHGFHPNHGRRKPRDIEPNLIMLPTVAEGFSE